MPNSAKHRSVSQQSAGEQQPQRQQSQPQRQQPGRRRAAKPKSSFGLAPAVAGVASLVAAAGGAVILQPAGGLAASDGAKGSDDSSKTTSQLAASDIQNARSKAEDRANRSSRGTSAGSASQPSAGKHAAERKAEAAELAAWEKKQASERSQTTRTATSSNKQVISRNIQFVKPVLSYRLSEPFGAAGSLWSADHTGQDFAAPSGTEIRAVGAGEIVEMEYSGSYGNRTKLRLNDGTEIWYCHQSAFKGSVGDNVQAGELIGYVGSTGNSTGPHLHLEVRPGGGGAIDPMPWLREHGIDV